MRQGRKIVSVLVLISREVLGWALVALGIVIFAVAYFEFLRHRKVFEAGLLIFPGFIVFRGGIHMLKVAIASQICTDVADREATGGTVKSTPARTR